MKKPLVILALLVWATVIFAGAALVQGGVSSKAIMSVNWQTNLETTPQGILFGLRDKNGDMPVGYLVVFQVQAPDGSKYQINRQVAARSSSFVEVVFPRDFNAGAGVLKPGPYLGKYLVAGKAVIMEKFNYNPAGGQDGIQHRQTWWGGSKKWVNLD